jgi:hypothetical protein
MMEGIIVGIGIGLILGAATIELVASMLFITKKLTPNPHMPYAMMSGVVFALAGVMLYMGGK